MAKVEKTETTKQAIIKTQELLINDNSLIIKYSTEKEQLYSSFQALKIAMDHQKDSIKENRFYYTDDMGEFKVINEDMIIYLTIK